LYVLERDLNLVGCMLSLQVNRFMRTTTIGSFPPMGEDLERAIRNVTDLQRRFGIEILSDGEQRRDMIGYFSSSLPGLSLHNKTSSVMGKILPMRNPEGFPKIDDFKFVKSIYPESEIKVSITGPVTLGFMCAFGGIRGYYSSMKDPRLYADLSEALKGIVNCLSDLGAYVQVDEPGLSQGFMDPVEAVKFIDHVASDSDWEKMSIHVCGELRTFKIAEHLLNLTNFGILSHAFAGKAEKSNIDVFSRRELQNTGKKLGIGCISVTPTKVETVDLPDDVVHLIVKLVERTGEENIAYVHPDCGLRASPPYVVEKILENLQLGVRRVRGR
jgi:methionine synthase II (cobalamin-independent)